MHPALANDLAGIDEILQRTAHEALNILAGLDARPVAVALGVPDPIRAPERGMGFAGALQAFTARYADGFSGSAGPRYLGSSRAA